MSRSMISAVAATLLLAAGTCLAAASATDDAPSPKITPALAKTFRAAQEAAKAKKWQEVITKAQEALAAPNRTPDDNYYAYYLLFSANHGLDNRDEERKALRGLVDSGFLNSAQVAPYVKALM